MGRSLTIRSFPPPPRETQEDEFCEYFSKFGAIKEHTIKKDEIGRSKGFGFILFEDPSSVDKVLAEENHSLGNRKIQPKKATPKERVRKIFVGGVSPELAEEEIRKHFEQFGEIGTSSTDLARFLGRKKMRSDMKALDERGKGHSDFSIQ